ncbi:MAG: hypothetical protein ACUVQG_08910 [Thermogutta sp.]
MRLTLRTLLAYLDNILDPEDAAELRRKIEESDVAKTILRRIRELLRKDRLEAPDVYTGENSLDPNTVAEYLDNTLPAEQVADFEKICLESEIELAEVAACHQILTMILGEPAEVDPKTREKMYRLPQMISQSEKAIEKIAKELVAEIPTEESTARSGAAETEMRKQPEPVTFATSAPHFRSWLLGLAVLLVVGVIGVGVLVIFKTLRPAPPSIPQGELAQRTEQVEQAPSTAQPGLPPEQETSHTPKEIPSDISEVAPATGGAAPEGEEGSMTMPPPPEKTVPLPTDQELPTQHAASPINEEQVARPTEEQPAPPVADLIPAPAPAITPQKDVPGRSIVASPVPVVPEAAPLPPEPVGQIVEDLRVTPLVFQIYPDGRILQRVPLNEPLKTCDAFFVPPRYRVTIRLADSVELVCVGPTFFELLPVDAQGQLGISLSFGQIIMSSRQVGSTNLRLKCGNIEGRINFEDSQSQVAISVVRQTTCPGDPETQPVPWVIDMFSLGGTARWFDAQHPRPIVLRAPVQMRLSEAELLAIPMTEQPEWVKVRVTTTSILEERAMAILENALQDNEKDPLLVLREQAGARQREVAWLAQRTLAYAGEPDVIWRILGEPEYRPLWPEAVTTLAELVRISPHHAAAVRAAAEKTLAANGPAAYAMLWRYPETGITLAQAQELVQQLENDSLAIRVVAYWTLRQITGMTLNYEPHASASDRSKAVQLWRERLTKGTVRGVGNPPSQL